VSPIEGAGASNAVPGDVYPNPTTDRATLELAVLRPTEVRADVLNAMGKTLRTYTANMAAGRQQLHMDMATLPAGLYLVRVTANGQTVATHRVVKQ